MPAGADTVFMQEDCRIEGDLVLLPPGLNWSAILAASTRTH
jgi:hypothetical protein